MESAAASERAAKSFRGAAAMGRKYGPYSLAGTMQADMVGKLRKIPSGLEVHCIKLNKKFWVLVRSGELCVCSKGKLP